MMHARAPGHRGEPLRALLVGALTLGLLGAALTFDTATARADEAADAAAAAKDAFDEGEAAREELRWSDASEAYWRAIEEDVSHYRAHVRYQESTLRALGTLDDLRSDYEALRSDYPSATALRFHTVRLTPATERLAQLEALRKELGDSCDLQLEVGRALLATGDAEGAVRALNKAVATAPAARIDVMLLLAEAEMRAGTLEPARKRLESLVQAKPQAWLAHLQLARLDLREEQPAQAEARSQTVLAQRPTFIAAFLVRAEALAKLDKTKEALALLLSARRIAPENQALLLSLADLSARSGDEAGFTAAQGFYRAVLDLNEESLHAIYGLGWVLERQEKFEDAEEQYREAMALNPTSPETANSIGYVLLKQGRVSEAQVQFKKALGLRESFVTAKANLGATFDAQTKWGEAIAIYEQILKSRDQRDNLRVLINCAFDYEANGAFNKAAKLLEQAHQASPDDPNILVWLADNFYFQKKWKKAEGQYREALAMDEKLFFGWRGLGYALAQRQRQEDAIDALERAYALDKEAIDILVAIGDMHLGEEQYKEALARYEAYAAAGGDDPDVLDIIDELQAEFEEE